VSHDDSKSRRARVRSWLLAVGTCAAVLAIAAVGEAIYPGLNRTSDEFFVTCGHVAPLFGLALFVEITVLMARVIHAQGSTAANKATVHTLVRINAGMLVVSEAAALYAVGAKASSTFLVICSVLPWLAQLALLVDVTYHRIGLSRLGSG
jgi:hypothetical protein